MKNIKVPKYLKHDIGHRMHLVYRERFLPTWNEFIPEIERCYPNLSNDLHWDAVDIKTKIVHTHWFKHSVFYG